MYHTSGDIRIIQSTYPIGIPHCHLPNFSQHLPHIYVNVHVNIIGIFI